MKLRPLRLAIGFAFSTIAPAAAQEVILPPGPVPTYLWKSVGIGDCTGSDIALTEDLKDPIVSRCDSHSVGQTAVCWDGVNFSNSQRQGAFCTYKSVSASECGGGANPGIVYECMQITTDKTQIATSTDEKTGITTTSIKNQDGSTTVTKKNPDGTIISEETIHKDEQGEVASFSATDPKSGITTTSVKNPDGSRTITKTDKDGKVISENLFPPKGKGLAKGTLVDPETGDVTTVITNPDGSRSIAKSKVTVDEDGTEHTIAMDENGNSIESTITPDGVVTTKKTDKYGNTLETVLSKDGTLTSVEKTVTGHTTETTRDPNGVNKIVKKDLDGSVTETIEKYPDGTTVTTDRHGNTVEVLPPNENGETVTVWVDNKGNEKVVITNDKGETIFRDETRETPKEAGREYYETVMGGEDWDDLPKSSKTRYAGSERRIRENDELRNQRDARDQEEVARKRRERERLAQAHDKLDKDLAAIKAEQDAADIKAAARDAKKARQLELQASYEKADKLQQQYDAAIKRGDKKEAKRIEGLQDEHEQASMKVLEFTEDEKKGMEKKTALRQKLMDQIRREASFEAHKENLERTQNDPYKDVVLGGASVLSIGAQQQIDLAKSNRQEDRLLSYTKHKDQVIERLLNKKDLTPEEREILIDIADLSSLQRDGALEKKAANNRIVAAGYAIDGAMLLSGGVGNVAAGFGAKVAGKVVAAKVATKVFAKKVAQGVATKTAAKIALKKGAKAGEKVSEKLMKLAQYDLKTGASKKVIEKVVARQTAKKVLAKKLGEGVTKEVAEKSAKKIGEHVGKKVAKEVGKEISEKGLITTVGSKAGGKIVEKVAGKQTGKAVEKALAKKRSIIPESVKNLVKGTAAKESTRASATVPPPPKSPKAPVGKLLPPRAAPQVAKAVPAKPPARAPPAGTGAAKPGPPESAAVGSGNPKPAAAPRQPAPARSPASATPAAKPVPEKVAGATTILDDPLKGAVGRKGSTEVIKAAKNTGAKPKPSARKEAPKYPKDKKPSEMTPAERQAHSDAMAQKEVSKKWKEKAPLEDGGSDILPSPTGRPTDLPVGELSRNLTPRQIEELFKPGANLTRKQIQQKADLILKRRMDTRVSASTGVTGKTLPPPRKKTANLDPNKTVPPPGKSLSDPVGKNSIMPKGKAGGMPKENVGGMPKGKVGGLPKGKAGTMPEGKVGGMAELRKGYPRGMPDGKVGGLMDRSILKGKAGKKVTDPRPFGMLPRVMKSIQKEVNQAGLNVRIRAANDSAIAKLRAGHPPKHVKLKSKTINDLDIQLGAPPGSQGMVGYFKPKRPKDLKLPKKPDNPNKLQLEKYNERVKELSKNHQKLMKRYRQRLKEYPDNFRDMKKLKDQGLVTVEDGVVIDRGLSNTRLGKGGKLIVNRKGPAGGTGKGFTGDHDMWDITHPDGRPIITNPNAPGFNADALRRKIRLQEALDRGLAQTQHGPHKDWTPITKRDIGIDKKIRVSHNPGGEALLKFTPNQPPRTSYEIDKAGKLIVESGRK